MNEKVKEREKEVKSVRRGFMKLTLKELETLGIDLKDVFSIKGTTLNFSWEKLIRLINYLADKKVLGYEHTFEEAVNIIGIFLV